MFAVLALGVVLTARVPAFAAAISQGYRSSESLVGGTLVAVNASNNQVTASDATNSDGLLGVVVSGQDSVLTIKKASDTLQVATSGTSEVYVSDANGPIVAGDHIAPSPIKGVGMKASANGRVLGIAQADFDGTKAIKTTSLTTKNGRKQVVAVGAVPVAIQVGQYTAAANAVPSFLQQFANAAAGKQVPLGRLVLVGVVMMASIILVTIILFSAVRGAIVSLGRNPLAQSSIYRGMFQAMGVSVVIMGIAVTGAYAILSY